ncbi:MAG: hypothetical protein K2Y35_12425 [Burkholderiales bacterium]|nr:hypothetical protein [Burkholderiales bacterium]
MTDYVALGRLLMAAALMCLIAAFGNANAGDIDGTWRLKKRVLPDGTVLVPPAVAGMGTAIDGMRHLNVFWTRPDGRTGSVGLISKYRITANTYSETLLASAFDDGSGSPVARGTSGETRTVPVTREGGRVSYQLPFDPPKVVYEGDTLTATLEGAFVDYWERVK